MQNNNNKKVLITGASRGIGLAIAEIFRNNGYSVVTPSHSEMDLSVIDSVKHYVSTHSNDIDILVNNAGINPLQGILDIEYKDYIKVFQTNLFSSLELIKWCTPYWISKRSGHIINISSIWGSVSKPKRLLYGASKSALDNITKNLALELGGYNVLVNAIAPGFINTELTKVNNSQAELAKIVKQIPVGRMAEPAEVAELVFYLGTKNTFITGQTLHIDGGYTCQ